MKTKGYKHTLLMLLLAALWGSGKAQHLPYEYTPWGKRGISRMQYGLEQKDAKYVFMARFLEDTCIWYDQNIYTVHLIEVIGVFRGDIKLGKLQIGQWGGTVGNTSAGSTAGQPYGMSIGATAVIIAEDFLPELSVYGSLSNKGVFKWFHDAGYGYTMYTPSMNQAGKMLDFYSDFSLRRIDTAWAADSARLAREAGIEGKQKQEEERRRAEAERKKKEKQRRRNERIRKQIQGIEEVE